MHGGQISRTTLLVFILILVLSASAASLEMSIVSIPSNGTVDSNSVSITIDPNSVISVNNFSLGVQLDSSRRIMINGSVQRQLVQGAGFKLIRLFDFRDSDLSLMPVTSWNESAKTGTFNWTKVDILVKSILDIGAQPLFCLGSVRTSPITDYLPPGMKVNPTTGLPYPNSYAAYAKEWVKHFKALAWPVKYYEIINEPFFYFGWTPNMTRLGYYVQLWDTVAEAMRSVNPKIYISQDSIGIKKVLNYWVQYGDNIDFLDFHKYDGVYVGDYNDSAMFLRAEQLWFETTTTRYGVDEARQIWFNARGKLLPVVDSESNFNSAWSNGTDPRIQQMAGAVWTALVLRTSIQKGLQYSVYYEFSSSASYWQKKPSGGLGLGSVNLDNSQPWYPYYVQKWVGTSLSVGDSIVRSASSSDDVKVLAWLDNGKLNLLLISKTDQPETVYLQGLTSQLSFSKIDAGFSYLTPKVQSGTIIPPQPLVLNGYTVMLLQTAYH